MFAYFYQLCAVVFLLQGVSTPVLLLVLYLRWRKQSRQLEDLRAELEADDGKGVKSDKLFEALLRRLPKLRPLKCVNCGGAVLLGEGATRCPYCETVGDLPENYAEAVSLKARAADLLKSAVRHWRVANVLTHPVVRRVFFFMIFAEPLVLFPVVLIGSNLYPDTWVDRAFGALGETTGFLVMLSAFLGFVVWMIVFIMLTNLSKTLRAKLPVRPVFKRRALGRETASCQSCGGGVEYDAGDFACLCGYCNVENFRVQFARHARAHAEKELALTKSALFGAMEIIEDYVGSAFFLLAILSAACVLLALIAAFKNL
jgi:hypothetical protein